MLEKNDQDAVKQESVNSTMSLSACKDEQDIRNSVGEKNDVNSTMSLSACKGEQDIRNCVGEKNGNSTKTLSSCEDGEDDYLYEKIDDCNDDEDDGDVVMVKGNSLNFGAIYRPGINKPEDVDTGVVETCDQKDKGKARTSRKGVINKSTLAKLRAEAQKWCNLSDEEGEGKSGSQKGRNLRSQERPQGEGGDLKDKGKPKKHKEEVPKAVHKAAKLKQTKKDSTADLSEQEYEEKRRVEILRELETVPPEMVVMPEEKESFMQEAESILQIIKSEACAVYLGKVSRGEVPSQRHDLFLQRNGWQRVWVHSPHFQIW